MSERYFHLEDYEDESVPCKPSLAGWAEWLSKPDTEWSRPDAATDGERFRCHVMRMESDIVARYIDGEWTFSRPIGNPGFLAVRFDAGLGWSADDIVCLTNEYMAEQELIEHLGQFDQLEPVYIAAGFNETPQMLVYRAGPPPTLTPEGPVQ